eukprot:gnl/TRDRNA2_/TRDRNA2_48988_c0_seq2.p2 gnl/TRDRNA2_/TRDRNA2_48988_c0~~gnl/TRDRNA2_/TRDRNA2_48988_c0_seq2.p2  ORF type:complete len:178 (+),score=38.22 gnl/TRDRNA2_/TRDRNA2_48988_c0_seq2:50-535(+)
MSSIHAALVNDAKGRGFLTRHNPVLQRSNQERDEGYAHADEDKRRQEQREQRRAERLAEGGRAGGYNDRQSEAEKVVHERVASTTDDDGYDEFGRRISEHRKANVPLPSKNERAYAALQRKAAKLAALQSKGSAQTGDSASSTRRSRSRSRDDRGGRRGAL